MSYGLRVLTKHLKEYDRELYAKHGDQGKILIMRKGYRYVPYQINDESYILYNHRDDNLVFPLTHNWSLRGKPVPWGIEPILKRLREIDGWKRDVFQEEIIKKNEALEKSKARDLRNNTEAFFSEFHSQYKEAFKDVNTSTVAKIDKRRKYDKRIKEN